MKLTIPGKPTPKARPRVVSAKGKRWTYSPTADQEVDVRTLAQAMAEDCKPMEGPVRMTVFFYPYRTEVEVEPAEEGKIKRPDLINYLAFLADALQGAAYLDDAQVVEIHAYKLQGEP